MAGLLEALNLRPIRREGGAAAPPPITVLAADLTKARAALVAARDAVTEALSRSDAQIRSLQALLAVHPDPDLKSIAGSPEFGLNALTGNYRVKVMAALRDLDAARPDALPPVLNKARTLVAGFQDHVRRSGQLEACDENPLGVKVGVRQQLLPALSQLSRAIEQFAG